MDPNDWSVEDWGSESSESEAPIPVVDEMDMPAEIARSSDQYDLTTGIGAYGYICEQLYKDEPTVQIFKNALANVTFGDEIKYIFDGKYICKIESENPFILASVDVPGCNTDDDDYVSIISIVYNALGGYHTCKIIADYARESIAQFSIGILPRYTTDFQIAKFPFSDFPKTPLVAGTYCAFGRFCGGLVPTDVALCILPIRTSFPLPDMLDFYIPAFDIMRRSETGVSFDWREFPDYMRVELNVGAGSHYVVDFPSRIQLIGLELVRRDMDTYIAYLYADSKLCEQKAVNKRKLNQFIGGESRWPPGAWIDSMFPRHKPAAEFGRQLRKLVLPTKRL